MLGAISAKFEKLYGSNTEVLSLKQVDGFDIDPDFVIRDVFDDREHVFVESSQPVATEKELPPLKRRKPDQPKNESQKPTVEAKVC